MDKKGIRKPEGGLLQSQEWAAVLRAEGKEVVDCGGGSYGVINTLKYVDNYLYIPRGGVTLEIENVLRVAQEHKCGWVRTDLQSEGDLLFYKNHTVIEAPHDMQPREHMIIDISHGADELLREMKGKCRYNIKLAEKKGVVTHYVTKEDQDFDQMLTIFHELTEKTGIKKGVRFHTKEHYAAMFDALPSDMIAIFAAEYDHHIIAANIVTFYGDTATYLHGGTDPDYRAVMAPHLLQWHMIRAAIGRGLRYYDFGGIYSDTNDPGKQGITRFKKSFAPQEQPLVMQGSYDIVIAPLRYKVYTTLLKIKKLLP